ncbi:heavy-metal-associated domain-containing protein [Pedobacter psychroterrae]|uniref:Copper chaperone n=1 Tax=Pedobacter psychroterrae TaxID=2530453 RepID=A0A4R0NLG4_9SPHI|nr:heavy-metal-associated domain-containing protein [Pedobacter psychroterrae]TCD01650.1 copper chaperone [Pedobacter psychroterrae]
MHTIKFKTNIKCGGCVATVTPFLNAISSKWSVDTENPDKVLSIDTDEPVNPKQVISVLDTAGYKAEKI